MMKLLLSFIFIFGGLFTLPAAATQHDLSRILAACSGLECQAPYEMELVWKNGETSSSDLQEKLNRLAFDLAQIWGDTILEGDLVSAADLQLDWIRAIRAEGVIVAYAISYSETAWDTMTCPYDPADSRSLIGCQQGLIREGVFVSSDLSSLEPDPAQMVRFEPSTN